MSESERRERERERGFSRVQSQNQLRERERQSALETPELRSGELKRRVHSLDPMTYIAGGLFTHFEADIFPTHSALDLPFSTSRSFYLFYSPLLSLSLDSFLHTHTHTHTHIHTHTHTHTHTTLYITSESDSNTGRKINSAQQMAFNSLNSSHPTGFGVLATPSLMDNCVQALVQQQ